MAGGGRSVDTAALVAGIRDGNRADLGKAISLVESRNTTDREIAGQLITELMPETGTSFRLGVTGVPGVGKSTFIDALGSKLTSQDNRVAVLAIDPSSSVTGGSILADKTRMGNLANDPKAFIRPTPSGGTLGGVAARTREAMLLCEAAGFNIVIVETVGIGQSETVVAEMTDSFLVLMLPGGGDELQGIKRGVMELADVIAVNKADGDSETVAKTTVRDYDAAMRLVRSGSSWRTPVLACSAASGTGIDDVWSKLVEHRKALLMSGELEMKRRRQRQSWLWSLVDDLMRERLLERADLSQELSSIESAVVEAEIPASVGARRIVDLGMGADTSG